MLPPVSDGCKRQQQSRQTFDNACNGKALLLEANAATRGVGRVRQAPLK